MIKIGLPFTDIDPSRIFFGNRSVGKEEKKDTRVKCLNRAVLGNIVVFTFYI